MSAATATEQHQQAQEHDNLDPVVPRSLIARRPSVSAVAAVVVSVAHENAPLELSARAARRKKRSAEPRPLPQPPPRGQTEQHMADAPLRGRGPSTASVCKEPCGSVWRYLRKAVLDARASFKLSNQRCTTSVTDRHVASTFILLDHSHRRKAMT
ncbi:MAG: hypothetical protein JWP89_3377 [Schlesneria sp.]|nr:hypothetical protein [Schlesneria sp.]